MDSELVLKGQQLLARKLWPEITDKTRVVFQAGKYKGLIIPILENWTTDIFKDALRYPRIQFRQIRIDVEAHTGGYMGYNAEIDTLVIRPLVTL